jgi:hypothetical protein
MICGPAAQLLPKPGNRLDAAGSRCHRSESPTGYSSAGCSPAEPASASPASSIIASSQCAASRPPGPPRCRCRSVTSLGEAIWGVNSGCRLTRSRWFPATGSSVWSRLAPAHGCEARADSDDDLAVFLGGFGGFSFPGRSRPCRGAQRALGLADRGEIMTGKRPDLFLPAWSTEYPWRGKVWCVRASLNSKEVR